MSTGLLQGGVWAIHGAGNRYPLDVTLDHAEDHPGPRLGYVTQVARRLSKREVIRTAWSREGPGCVLHWAVLTRTDADARSGPIGTVVMKRTDAYAYDTL